MNERDGAMSRHELLNQNAAVEDESAWARHELAQAGIPAWAPYGSDAVGTPRYYAWVDIDGELRGGLVGIRFRSKRTGGGTAALIEQCEQFLAGTSRRDAPGPDLDQATAMLLIRPDGAGHGSLSRPPGTCRPLGDLVRFALRQLQSGASSR